MKFIFKKNYSVKVWFKNMIKKPANKNTVTITLQKYQLLYPFHSSATYSCIFSSSAGKLFFLGFFCVLETISKFLMYRFSFFGT